MEVLLNQPNEDQVATLAQGGMSFDIIADDDGLSLLTVCVQNNDLATLALLLKYGANVDYEGDEDSEYSQTPLEEACFRQNLEAVRILLPYSPNVNHIDGYLISCLAKTFVPGVENPNIEISKAIAQLLLDAGADISLTNHQGHNVLQMIFGYDGVELTSAFIEESMQFLVSRGATFNDLLATTFRAGTVAQLKMLRRLGAVVDQNLTAHFFIYALRQSNIYLRKFIAVTYPEINLSDRMEQFFIFKLRHMLNPSTEAELMEAYSYYTQLISANYFTFIPNIDLYPIEKRNVIHTIMLLQQQELSILPNELLFIIFENL